MKSALFITWLVGFSLCLSDYGVVNKQQSSLIVNEDSSKWIEIERIIMSSDFDGHNHQVSATLFKLEKANMVYKVCYDWKFYNVITYIENGAIQCLVWIPYQGAKRCFSFVLQP